jgi:hypothetical protein
VDRSVGWEDLRAQAGTPVGAAHRIALPFAILVSTWLIALANLDYIR